MAYILTFEYSAKRVLFQRSSNLNGINQQEPLPYLRCPSIFTKGDHFRDFLFVFVDNLFLPK